jgi:hypothetical protein
LLPAVILKAPTAEKVEVSADDHVSFSAIFSEEEL